MTVVNFFLTRHGETQWNKVGKFQGQLDSPLTEKGYLQAQDIAAKLSRYDINFIISSTLTRAKKTAEICQLSLGCSLMLNTELIERNFGAWQGKYISEVKEDSNYDAIFHQVNKASPPNGESGIECAIRFKQALIHLANEYSNKFIHDTNIQQGIDHCNILLVSHGDILRCFLSAMVNNFSDNQAVNNLKKTFDNGCIFQVSYQLQEETFTFLAVHDTNQLAALALTE